MELHSSQLDEFIKAFHAVGGDASHPDLQHYWPLELRYSTTVDQALDPFSDEYFEQQLALYREISGRDLDQATGELHQFDFDAHLVAPNPTASYDATGVAEQVRALSTVVALACLGERPRVLDLGAGGGLSSEVFAYAGCRVHALDIDPQLGRLSRERAQRMKFDIQRTEINFDDVATIGGGYQGAFFYQSFHHCLRPWKLIEDLAAMLDQDGVIGFTGEPMQAVWWKDWGLRLDLESLLVARAHGWFESGWSHDFIRRCFERMGFTLLFFSGGHYGDIGIATRDAPKLAAIREKAAGLDLVERDGGVDVSDGRYLSGLGSRSTIDGLPAFVQSKDPPGALMFGPYITVEPGSLDISLMIERQPGDGEGELLVDIASDYGRKVHFARSYRSDEANGRLWFRERLDFAEKLVNLEVRAFVSGTARWSMSIPKIGRAAEPPLPVSPLVVAETDTGLALDPVPGPPPTEKGGQRPIGRRIYKWVRRRIRALAGF